MVHKLKNIIKFFIFYFLNLIIFPTKKIMPNSMLLIRLDTIGDYILFRNFIEIIKKSEKYKDYKITLLGNEAWKEIAQEFDGEFIDDFIWLNIRKFNRNLIYRYRKLKEIIKKGYEIVVDSTYSREFYYSDIIVKVLTAKEKTGSEGDLSNIEPWQKKISDTYYTKLISAEKEVIFEFYRNKEFFENFLETKLDVKKPHINLKPKNLFFQLPKEYAILFIGASLGNKKWRIENFAKVGRYIKSKYGYEIVLCGGKEDMNEVKKFKKYFGMDFTDLTGKTSLIDLLYVVYNGNVMVSNDTSAPHLAVALNMRGVVFVVYNGVHFGRFVPYPKEIYENYHAIYHPDIERDLENYQKLSNSYGYEYGNGIKLNINEIAAESVIENIKKNLQTTPLF